MNSRPVKRIEDVVRLRASQFSEDAGPMAHPVRQQAARAFFGMLCAAACSCSWPPAKGAACAPGRPLGLAACFLPCAGGVTGARCRAAAEGCVQMVLHAAARCSKSQRMNDLSHRKYCNTWPSDLAPPPQVRPDSYIKMDNFYTVTVYEKGAEVVRLYATLLGKEGFRWVGGRGLAGCVRVGLGAAETSILLVLVMHAAVQGGLQVGGHG